jgi:hypothetical protein
MSRLPRLAPALLKMPMAICRCYFEIMSQLRSVLVAFITFLQAGGLVLPADAGHTRRDHFEFRISTTPDRRKVGSLVYPRHLATPTLDAPAGWLDGDRIAYRCGYAFLEYRGVIVGRVIVTRIDPSNARPYVRVNDAYMVEGVRHVDGTVDPTPNQHNEECPRPTVKYQRLVGDADPVPIVTFQHGPHTIEVRDFGDPSDVKKVGQGHQFKTVEVTPDRIAVVAYQDRTPALAIYYDRMYSEVVPGTMHPVTLLSGHPDEHQHEVGAGP